MKVLVNCYACSPYKGSEPGMGWNFVKCLSRLHELHIITESKFQPDIEHFLSEHPEEHKYFRFYFVRKYDHDKLREIWPPSYYWFYKAWQKKVLKLVKELDKEENFDLIHQLNMVGYREPGYLWKIDKPFVWGPIGGFGNTPWCMLASMGVKGMLYYGSRNIVNLWQMMTSTRVKTAMKRAGGIISATEDTSKTIKRLYSRESIVVPEVGAVGDVSTTFPTRYDGEKLRICWSGQHTSGKALNLLIESLANMNRDDVELHVIGEGNETDKWKRLTKKLCLNNVVWHGWLDKDKAHEVMQSCHLLCITSLKDLTSTVLLEGLSFGLPVIALDHCGFRNVITDECGIKIRIESKKQVVCDFSKAIEKLVGDELLRRRLSEGALIRSLEYKWEDKALAINKLYESVLK